MSCATSSPSTKVNYNSCDYASGLPVTLKFAERVGARHRRCHSASTSDLERSPYGNARQAAQGARARPPRVKVVEALSSPLVGEDNGGGSLQALSSIVRQSQLKGSPN